MKWLLQQKVGVKFFLSYFLTGIIALLVGMAGCHGMVRIMKNHDAVSNGGFNQMRLLADINTALLMARGDIRVALSTKVETRRQTYLKSAVEQGEKVEQLLTEFERTPMTPAQKDSVLSLHATWRHYLEVRARVLPLIGEGNDAEAQERMDGEISTAMIRSRSLLVSVNTQLKTIAQEQNNEAEKAANTATWQLAIVLIVGSTVVVGFVVNHSRLVRSPLKRDIEKLKRSELLLRDSQEVAKIGCFVANLVTEQWEISRTLITIFGIPNTTYHDGRFLLDLITPQFKQSVVDQYLRLIIETGRIHLDFQIIRPADGAMRWVSADCELETDSSGSPARLIGTIQDITERKLLEQQLFQSQKLEGVGMLAGGIVHDFNNLLSMVLGSAELLGKQLAGQPKLKKYTDRIIEAAERGTSISRQLLIFSRPDQAELQPISLSHTIAELIELLRHFLPKTIVIDVVIDVSDGTIMGDGGQIHQALLNLAINARDAMKNTGTLTIRAVNVSPEFIHEKFLALVSVPFVALSVADTGTGIEEAVLANMFEPFFTTKPKGKGTGLGLAMVQGIVKAHNGFIDVSSTVGEGTTITMYFPAMV